MYLIHDILYNKMVLKYYFVFSCLEVFNLLMSQDRILFHPKYFYDISASLNVKIFCSEKK